MMSRYHLTTIFTDSSRPNTPKHAKKFPACCGYLISIFKTSPVNFHQHTNSRPHASIPPRPGHGIRRHGRRAVLSRCNSTCRNHLVIIGQALVPCAGSRQCRMQRRAAPRRATRSASASAESGAVSKPKPQRRQRQPRHPGQLGPGPGPQAAAAAQQGKHKKTPAPGCCVFSKRQKQSTKKIPPRTCMFGQRAAGRLPAASSQF